MSKKKKLFNQLDVISQELNTSNTFVKSNIQIDPTLKALIPPLGEEELVLLEQNILVEGVREPLIVWEGKNILVDGHNRYQIALKHNLSFNISQKTFSSEEEVRNWMITNQLGRRNLTPEQASFLRGLRFKNEKQKKGGNEKVEKGKKSPIYQNDRKVDTAEKLAKEYGVGVATINRDAQYAEGIEKVGEANPELKSEILSGKLKVKKSDIQMLAKADSLPKAESVEELITSVKTKTSPKKKASQELTKGEREGKIKHQQEKLQYHATQLRELGLTKQEIIAIIKGLK